MIEAQLKEDIEFWCDICDAKKIHSKKWETGLFFRQWGCTSKDEFGEAKVSDDYTFVIFAICRECLNDYHPYFVRE